MKPGGFSKTHRPTVRIRRSARTAVRPATRLLPAARKAVQTPEDDDAETDLADLDDDEPIKKVLQKRIERERALKAELRELKEQHRRSEEAEAIRVQQQVVQELHNEFYRIAPDLFGDGKKANGRATQQAQPRD